MVFVIFPDYCEEECPVCFHDDVFLIYLIYIWSYGLNCKIMSEKKIKIRMIETWTTIIVRECLEVDPGDFRELDGMTMDEMKDHIRDNSHTIEREEGGVKYSIFEMCCNEDVVRERIKNETYYIEFE